MLASVSHGLDANPKFPDMVVTAIENNTPYTFSCNDRRNQRPITLLPNKITAVNMPIATLNHLDDENPKEELAQFTINQTEKIDDNFFDMVANIALEARAYNRGQFWVLSLPQVITHLIIRYGNCITTTKSTTSLRVSEDELKKGIRLECKLIFYMHTNYEKKTYPAIKVEYLN